MLVAIPTKIEDSSRSENRPVANSVLVIANVVLFTFAQTPAWAIAPGGSLWSVITYAFYHASPWHLIGNMYVLLLVGNAVNRRIGSAWYLATYFGTVIGMGILGRLLGIGPLMGSSGAIFALVAVLLMLLPAAIVDFSYVALFPLTILLGLIHRPTEAVDWFLRFGQLRLRAWWCVLIVPVLELWAFFWWRFAMGDWQWTQPAHLLGLLCGVVCVLLMPTRITMGRTTV